MRRPADVLFLPPKQLNYGYGGRVRNQPRKFWRSLTVWSFSSRTWSNGFSRLLLKFQKCGQQFVRAHDVSFPIVAVCIDHAGYTTSGVGLTGISQDHPCFDRLSAMISQYFFTALSPYSGDAIRDRRFRQATKPAAPSASQPREFWSGDCSLLDVCPALIGSPTVGTSGSLPEKTIAL